MKSVLVVLPYDRVYPPMNGGMLRCFHLLVQLAGNMDVTAVIHQDLYSFLEAKGDYPVIERMKIYSTKDNPLKKDLFSMMPKKVKTALRYRWQKRTFKGPSDANFLLFNPILKRLLKKKHYDIVLLENISSINCVSLIKRLNRDAKIIYDAHNVDSALAREEYHKSGAGEKIYELLYSVESNLSKTIDGIAVCSAKDLQDLQKLNNDKLKAAIIPNGVKIDRFRNTNEIAEPSGGRLLFCGSLDYAPNVEGLLWFYRNVWPELLRKRPDSMLTIVGGGTPDVQLQDLQNTDAIKFVGKVPEVTKFYEESTIAIVPLLSGSGTRLKILEAMSLGVPVVSTSKGAEGIDCYDGRNILIADDKEQFAEAIKRLIEDRSLHNEISRNAFDLVKDKYDWKIIGNNLTRFLNSFYE